MKYLLEITGKMDLVPVLPVTKVYDLPSFNSDFAPDFFGLAITAWIDASRRVGTGAVDMLLSIKITSIDNGVECATFNTEVEMYHRYNSNLMSFIESLFNVCKLYSE
jgi:hypothetical protein